MEIGRQPELTQRDKALEYWTEQYLKVLFAKYNISICERCKHVPLGECEDCLDSAAEFIETISDMTPPEFDFWMDQQLAERVAQAA
jgi:hypothetical protein